MRILVTTRNLPKETLGLDRFAELDAQGVPSYTRGGSFEANVLEQDGLGEQFVVDAHGSKIMTPLTLYVMGDSEVVPAAQDRVRLSDGREFIVAERTAPRGLRQTRDEVDHYRLRCRV